MSINKNFVVKNGLEVNTDLILANASTKRVGIGSTVPQYTLDVRGGIGVTDIYAVGISTVLTELNVGTGGTALTALGSGLVGVGTENPAYLLDVRLPVSTGQTALYVQGDVRVTGDLSVDDITFDSASLSSLEVTGIATISTLGVSGLTTTQNLQVTGVSTFVGFSTFNDYVDIQDGLRVSGVSTFAGITTVTGETLFTKQLNSSGVAILNNGLQVVSGITTLGVTTTTNLTTQNLNVSGISTLGTVKISSGIVTATSGVVTYYGDGQYLDNVIRGVGIGTSTGIVGYGATILNFQGPGISTITVASGIATINITGGGTGSASIGIGTTPGEAFVGLITAGNLWYNSNLGRMFIYYDDGNSKQWVDASPSNIGIITSLTNVSFSAGSATSPSMYFIGDAQTGFFSPSAGRFTIVSSGSSVLNVNPSGVNITGVVTASSFSGNASSATNVIGGIASVTSLNVSGVSTFTGITTSTSTLFTNQLSASGVSTFAGITTVTGPTLFSKQLNVSGVSTFAGITTSTSTLFTNQLSASGIITANSTIIVGSAITITSSGINASAGIITCRTLSNAILSNYSEPFVNIGNTGSATTLGLSTSGYFIATLNQTTTFTFNSTGIPSQYFGFALQLKNGTGGPFSITWPASVYWPDGGSTPSRTTIDSRTDIWSFTTTNGGTTWLGNLSILNYTV